MKVSYINLGNSILGIGNKKNRGLEIERALKSSRNYKDAIVTRAKRVRKGRHIEKIRSVFDFCYE